MTSIYETLKNIELGRQNCIKNAKLAHLPATDNMDIYTLGELFLQQNNKEDIDPISEWQRPGDWWDTETILKNAEIRDGLYPSYILLLADWDISTIFSKKDNNDAYCFLGGDGYLTSDGSWYTGSNSFEHVWDISKDKPCSLGYKTRWVLVYRSEETINGVKYPIRLQHFKCLECIYGRSKMHGSMFGGNTFKNEILHIKELDNTEYNSNEYPYFQRIPTLRKISLSSITTKHTSLSFSNCISLTDIELLNINYVPDFSDCVSLRRVHLPLAVSLSGNGGFYDCFSLKHLSLPNLVTMEPSSSSFSYCRSLENINLPKLKSIKFSSGNIFNQCPNIKYINMSSLEKIICDNNATRFFDNSRAIEYINIPSLKTPISLPDNFPSTAIIDFGNVFKISGFNFGNIEFTKTFLLNLISKLADVTNEDDTYTITLGSINLAKLTAEEIAIATNKGWIVS